MLILEASLLTWTIFYRKGGGGGGCVGGWGGGGGRGGGVSLLISEKKIDVYRASRVKYCRRSYRVCFRENHVQRYCIHCVGTVYRPPNCNIIDFNDAMSNILEKIGHNSCYIMGDFNLDLMKHDKHPPTEKFLDVMYANHLIPVINRPTRVTMNTCTLIDNTFTNQYDVRENQLHGILKTDITDHFCDPLCVYLIMYWIHVSYLAINTFSLSLSLSYIW